MPGETDLKTLLKTMLPMLHEAPFGYAALPEGLDIPGTFATVREAEGLTVIAPVAALGNHPHQGPFAKISLTVHSSLAAVGLTAAIATALAKHGIPANVVAGYFHDHVFVAWDQRDQAMRAINELSRNA